jgi:histidyl-tRNA synthetase
MWRRPSDLPDSMTDKQSTKPPSGTRDFLPDDIRRREHVIGVARDVYQRYGFEPLETPAFENIETLLGKYGEEGNKLIFKILKRGEHEATGEADLALRYDLTVPLARVVAQYQNDLPKFFKRYQIQPVWRADRPARGRFREFYQCDIDAIGSTSSVVEVEILSAVSEILKTLGFEDFIIRLNDRRLLDALLQAAGVPAFLTAPALVAIDKRDKIGRDGVIAELVNRGIESPVANRCIELLTPDIENRTFRQLAGDPSLNDAILDHLREAVRPHSDGLVALQSLANIRSIAHGTPAWERLAFDPSLARGLSYYTGAIMEIAVEGIGSLGGGGRYDNLIGMFLGRDVPACGFSLGLERIIVLMTERNMFPPAVARGAVDVLVTIWNDASSADSLALAAELRKGGLRVDVYPEPDKLGKQVKYASSRNVPFVAILGDDERARSEVAVKDLRSGEQTAMARDQVAGFVAANRELRT